MKYYQERNIKQVFVNLFNKIFTLNSLWVNTNVEVISVSGDNSPDVVEQYPWDKEKYPIVVITGVGSSSDSWGFNDIVSDVYDTLYIGQQARNYTELNTTPIAFGIQSYSGSLQLRSVEVALKWNGPITENITVLLRSAGGNPLLPTTLLASGSIAGKQFASMDWGVTALTPMITLAENVPYFITLQAEGSYYIMLDTAPSLVYTPFVSYTTRTEDWNTPDRTQTVLAKVNGPVHRRLGGGINTSLSVFVESKDLSTTQKIADLIFVYLHTLRHSNPVRSQQLTYAVGSNMQYDFFSDLSDNGIYIIDIAKGTETVRNRGNDRLWSVNLTVSCYGNWLEDFGLSDLRDFDLDVSNY